MAFGGDVRATVEVGEVDCGPGWGVADDSWVAVLVSGGGFSVGSGAVGDGWDVTIRVGVWLGVGGSAVGSDEVGDGWVVADGFWAGVVVGVGGVTVSRGEVGDGWVVADGFWAGVVVGVGGVTVSRGEVGDVRGVTVRVGV